MRSFSFPPNPQPFLATTKGDAPLETPNLYFYFRFLLFLLVVISFGYLAIYTNEYLLLLNNVDRQNECYFLKNKIFEVSGGGFGAILVHKN